MAEAMVMTDEERKKANRRLGLILGSIALAFFVGFIVKWVLLGN